MLRCGAEPLAGETGDVPAHGRRGGEQAETVGETVGETELPGEVAPAGAEAEHAEHAAVVAEILSGRRGVVGKKAVMLVKDGPLPQNSTFSTTKAILYQETNGLLKRSMRGTTASAPCLAI